MLRVSHASWYYTTIHASTLSNLFNQLKKGKKENTDWIGPGWMDGSWMAIICCLIRTKWVLINYIYQAHCFGKLDQNQVQINSKPPLVYSSFDHDPTAQGKMPCGVWHKLIRPSCTIYACHIYIVT
jgi:hypothetical protein